MTTSSQHYPGYGIREGIVATFSIAGYDPATGELGIAVQSKFLAVGAVVPWAQAGVGAVATQAYANPSYGPEGLDLLAAGKTAEETVGALTEADGDRAHRQFGIIDARGRSAIYTGEACFDWAGGIAGTDYTAQGNILVGKETVEALARTFEETAGEARLADRLLAALSAAQEAGGDSRGQQSAALLVVREGGGYGGHNDRATDLRVDEHPEPIQELRRLHDLHGLYFGDVKSENVVRLEGEAREGAAAALRRLGYLDRGEPPEDGALQEALAAFIRTENFEEREQEEGYVDHEVLRFLKGRG